MSDARQVATARYDGRRAALVRNTTVNAWLHNALFALAFGFAAAVIFGFVN